MEEETTMTVKEAQKSAKMLRVVRFLRGKRK